MTKPSGSELYLPQPRPHRLHQIPECRGGWVCGRRHQNGYTSPLGSRHTRALEWAPVTQTRKAYTEFAVSLIQLCVNYSINVTCLGPAAGTGKSEQNFRTEGAPNSDTRMAFITFNDDAILIGGNLEQDHTSTFSHFYSSFIQLQKSLFHLFFHCVVLMRLFMWL